MVRKKDDPINWTMEKLGVELLRADQIDANEFISLLRKYYWILKNMPIGPCGNSCYHEHNLSLVYSLMSINEIPDDFEFSDHVIRKIESFVVNASRGTFMAGLLED